MSERRNRQWRVKSLPHGRIRPEDFEFVEDAVPEIRDGEMLLRSIYLSLDPANRGWLSGRRTYVAPVQAGDVMRGATVGVVEDSRLEGYSAGDLVLCAIGWQDYAVSDGKGVTKIPSGPLPLTAHLGLLGHIGLTAYFGLLDVGKPKAGETLVVSTAAGAVGSLVSQIGKIKGCRVVGIAGGEEKCSWLTGELGLDAAIDYKNENVAKALRAACPDGIDIYFDNVGGEILEAALSLIRERARVVICGMISQYNATEPVPGPKNLIQLLAQRARMEGFIVLDYLSRASEAVGELVRWHLEGKLKYRVDVIDGLEQAPVAINRLFDGTNRGKLAVRVSEEPSPSA